MGATNGHGVGMASPSYHGAALADHEERDGWDGWDGWDYLILWCEHSTNCCSRLWVKRWFIVTLLMLATTGLFAGLFGGYYSAWRDATDNTDHECLWTMGSMLFTDKSTNPKAHPFAITGGQIRYNPEWSPTHRCHPTYERHFPKVSADTVRVGRLLSAGGHWPAFPPNPPATPGASHETMTSAIHPNVKTLKRNRCNRTIEVNHYCNQTKTTSKPWSFTDCNEWQVCGYNSALELRGDVKGKILYCWCERK